MPSSSTPTAGNRRAPSAPTSPAFRIVPTPYGAVGDDDEEYGRTAAEAFDVDAGPLATLTTRWIVLVFAFLVSSLVVLVSWPPRGSDGEIPLSTTTFETATDAAEASISDILAAIRAGRINSSSSSSSSSSSASTTTTTTETTPISTTTTTTTSASTSAAASTEPLTVKSVGDYGDAKKSVLAYPFLNAAVFVEPYKTHTLTVTNADAACTYAWTISGSALPSPLTYAGSAVQAAVAGVGLFSLNVAESCDASHSLGRTLTTDLWAKYVRRELLSLTETDREEFLDALLTTYMVNTRDGVAQYGPLYKSMYYFTSIHIDAAGNPVCDEFHKGGGFFSNHIYLGNYLEQSLQAVNPKVALHYMEYATYYTGTAWLDHMANQLDGGAWTELLSDKWFGRNDPYTGEILDGRWAASNVQIPFVNKQFFADHLVEESKTFFPVEEAQWLSWSTAHLRSPYGLLRPPWSFNPSRGISRYHNEVGLQVVPDSALSDFFMGQDCADYEYFLTVDVVGRTFDNFLEKIKEDAHGKIHFNIGGQGGDNARAIDKELMEKHNFTQDDIIVVTEASQKFGKIYISTRDFYQEYEATLKSEVYPVYPMNCSADPWDPQAETVRTMAGPRDWRDSSNPGPACQCADYYFSTPENLQTLIQIYFWKYVKNTYAQNITPAKVLAMPHAQQAEVMKLLCSRMAIDGDMVGSASPLDPVFWVSHGAIEKLYQRVLFADLLTDTDYTTPNTCSGHDPAGTKAWLDGYYFADRTVNTATLTNAELTNLLDPRAESYQRLVPYVYDSTLIGCAEVDDLLVQKSRR